MCRKRWLRRTAGVGALGMVLLSFSGVVTAQDRGCTIVGTSGNDELRGTTGRDVICGRGGVDDIHARRGADVVYGGDGDDGLFGDAGRDRLVGQRGYDYARGDQGADVLLGRGGTDCLYAVDRGPRDRVRGGPRRDYSDFDAGDSVRGVEQRNQGVCEQRAV